MVSEQALRVSIDDAVRVFWSGYNANPYGSTGRQQGRTAAGVAAVLALAQAAPGVPGGWKLVPVEPTDDMLNAYQEEQCRWSNITHVDDDATQSLWSAMLAATPQPGDDAVGGASAKPCYVISNRELCKWEKKK
jgi:hypothetical protein